MVPSVVRSFRRPRRGSGLLWFLALGAGLLLARPAPAVPANTAGSLDTQFGTAGVTKYEVNTDVNAFLDTANVGRQSDGKLVVAFSLWVQVGAFNGPHMALARFGSNGAIDTSFGNNGVLTLDFGDLSNSALTTFTSSLVIDSSDRILVGGTLTLLQGQNATGTAVLVRLQPDGELDDNFGSAGIVRTTIGTMGGGLNRLAITASGQILAVGTQQRDANNSDALVVRYNGNGTLDTNFGNQGFVVAQSSASSRAGGILAQSDGGFVVSGSRGNQAWVARYQSNGTPDATFGSGGQLLLKLGGQYNQLGTIVSQTGGALVLGGSATRSQHGNFTDYPALVRLTSAGKLDHSFGNGGKSVLKAPGSFDNLAVQADGSLLTAGAWGTSRYVFAVYRFTPKGKPDARFGVKGLVQLPGDSSTVSAGVLVLPDGNILAAGSYSFAGEFHAGLMLTRLHGQ